MSIRTRLILVVEADRAIRTKIIGVSRFGRMQALNSVHSPTSGHLSLSIQDEINFFCGFVVVRKICTRGREVHQEKVGDSVGRIDTVACSRTGSDQKLVEDRLRMALYRLLFQLP